MICPDQGLSDQRSKDRLATDAGKAQPGFAGATRPAVLFYLSAGNAYQPAEDGLCLSCIGIMQSAALIFIMLQSQSAT